MEVRGGGLEVGGGHVVRRRGMPRFVHGARINCVLQLHLWAAPVARRKVSRGHRAMAAAGRVLLPTRGLLRATCAGGAGATLFLRVRRFGDALESPPWARLRSLASGEHRVKAAPARLGGLRMVGRGGRVLAHALLHVPDLLLCAAQPKLRGLRGVTVDAATDVSFAIAAVYVHQRLPVLHQLFLVIEFNYGGVAVAHRRHWGREPWPRGGVARGVQGSCVETSS